jgi:hypothetical protein
MFEFTPKARGFAPSGELLIKGADLGLEVVSIIGRADPAGLLENPHGALLSGFRDTHQSICSVTSSFGLTSATCARSAAIP